MKYQLIEFKFGFDPYGRDDTKRIIEKSNDKKHLETLRDLMEKNARNYNGIYRIEKDNKNDKI